MAAATTLKIKTGFFLPIQSTIRHEILSGIAYRYL
jgi:hypothetical protein